MYITCARIHFDNKSYYSENYVPSSLKQLATIFVGKTERGFVEILYKENRPTIAEGPFLKEERQLIENLSSIVSNYLNSIQAQKLLQKASDEDNVRNELNQFRKPDEVSSRMLLQKFLNKQNANRETALSSPLK